MEKLKLAMKSCVDAWRERRYSEDGLFICGAIAGSKEMHENYGDTKKGFEKLLELINSGFTEEEIIQKLSEIAK